MIDKKKRARKKRFALLTSILLVALTLLYMIFGADIAQHVSGFDYSRLYRHFTAEIPDGQIEVHVIDVGQGDCTLIRSPDGSILIDSGTDLSEDGLKQYLTACGIETLDYFICTHPHEDHIGGADMIVESFGIGTLLMPDAASDVVEYEQLCEAIEAENVNVEIPEVGGTYTLGDMELRVLAPVTKSEELNDMSLVVRLTYGATAFLFTGDAEAASEREMLDTYNRLELGSDFSEARTSRLEHIHDRGVPCRCFPIDRRDLLRQRQ